MASTRDFYVRQLKDWKGSAEIEGDGSPEAMYVYGRCCGWTLARAHARSGDRVAIASYLGGGDAFDRAIGEFAEAYADQNERDYAALRRAEKSGRSSPGSACDQPCPQTIAGTLGDRMPLHRTTRATRTSREFLSTAPQFARAGEVQPIPRLRVPDGEMDPTPPTS